MDSLEDRYWVDLNDHFLRSRALGEEREAILHRIEVASHRLEVLKRTNVYNDAFRIWHDGSFGTINGFRLGKTSSQSAAAAAASSSASPSAPANSEWDELNAAWGQTVLLLHTMASACEEHHGFRFSKYKLHPMGSYPSISHGKHTFELFGPVTQFLHANYDKGMVAFLACVQELATFAKHYDVNRRGYAAKGSSSSSMPLFELPYNIEGDKVCGHTVRLRFNSNEKWTKALKYMLANLKVMLVWATSEGGPLCRDPPQQQQQPQQSSPKEQTE